MTQIEEYTIGQLARLSSVTVRTLHHYDEIGLLKPMRDGSNGYRLYDRARALRLQEILFYRDVGLSLSEISELLNSPADAVERLVRHRDRLQKQAHRTAKILDTLNTTIAHLKGEHDMAISELYQPFSAEQQAAYETWLTTEYGPEMAGKISRSKASIKQLPGGLEGAMDQLQVLECELVDAYENSKTAGSVELHSLLERHRAFITQMWGRECDASGYEGLADLYGSHADFIARYEQLSPKFSSWLTAAMKGHAVRIRSKS